MGKSSGSPKKRKLKSSDYVPISHLQRPSNPETLNSRTLQSTKLKKSSTGGFKIVNTRGISGSSVPNGLVNDPQSTEEILASWYAVSEQYGWDEAYVNSFVEKDLMPPNQDPELTPDAEKPTAKGDPVLHEWTKEIDNFLRIVITLEGKGEHSSNVCCGSGVSTRPCSREAVYRCLCCDNMGMMCRDCMREAHACHPFHRIQMWNGRYFERVSLKSTGLRIQLGHPPGESCLLPSKASKDDFVVIDCDSIHEIALDYCGCGQTAKGQVEQLLERRLYPATIANPKTAATFRCLEMFELLQYESKLTPFEFFNTVSRLTDNTNLRPVKDRYPSFLRMVHEWRHMRLLKRSGKGHDVGGAESTGKGECALLCPSCPHPGINMPVGWENEAESMRHIHALNVGLDANYRLKRKDVSDDTADPGLSKGFAYFVDDEPFREYLAEHENDTEPKSTCSRHDAVNLADVSPGQGYAASGVGTVECTRHNMKRPGGVCDLQRGERYSNMDYIFVSSLVLFGVLLLNTFVISYDIACQWSLNLFSRVAKINKDAPILKRKAKCRFVVPKFHLPAHIPSCQTRFAFMFTPGVGLGDGEAPERGWADSNPLGPSTREMGPGRRRDTLDFHFGDYNWWKITELSDFLYKKMDIATAGVAERIISHKEYEEGLEPEQVREWWKAVTAWEEDPISVANPFDMTVATPSQCAVRKALSQEEAAQKATQKEFTLSHDLSPSQLIARGIDLESEMRSLKLQMKKTWDHSRDRELTWIQLKSNTIVRKVEAWYRMIQVEIPASILLREEHASTSSRTIKPYELPLWLPSQIGRRAAFPDPLGTIEFRLRVAQADDALAAIRRNLQRRVTVWDLKNRWLRGQGANTKALNLLSNIQEKIQSSREEYNQARAAVLALAPLLRKTGYDRIYLPLADSDLVSLTADSVTAPSQGQTKKVGSSWIWKHPGARDDNLSAFDLETRKVEWGKSRARANRYQEEIQIVKEEMNRVLRFFQWKEGPTEGGGKRFMVQTCVTKLKKESSPHRLPPTTKEILKQQADAR
ncbi:hypothetical protein NMY22_g8368 [Coprinellus aureogranulatus]|nr:hypothetical protein NMY22_g8368 [Coprinellus aureogranulatus]